MGIFKRIVRSLFGSSRSSTPEKQAAAKKAPKVRKPAKKKPVKKAAKKTVKKAPKKKAVKAKAKVKVKAKPVKVKKTARKGKPRQPVLVKEALSLIPVGEVTHYFPHVNAAVVKVAQGEIREGEILSFRGHTTNFKQPANSMQIDHKPIQVARAGDELGIRVKSRVRAGDKVFKV
jgi:putative protease